MATQNVVREIVRELGKTVGAAELKQIAFEIFKTEHYYEPKDDGCTKYTDEGSCMEQYPERPASWCVLCATYDDKISGAAMRDFQALPVSLGF